MDSRFLKLDSILNLNKFQKIQDEIAMATDLAVITVDYRGMPVTKHSRCSDLCKIVRAIPRYSKMCEKCDSRGGMEASRMHTIHLFCHMGIVDFAIPIIVENQFWVRLWWSLLIKATEMIYWNQFFTIRPMKFVI